MGLGLKLTILETFLQKTKKIVAEAKEIKKEAATKKRTKKAETEQQIELDDM